MSHRDDAHDKLLADIVEDRAEATRAFDEALNPSEQAEVELLSVPDDTRASAEAGHELMDILGDAIEELVDLENSGTGPIEFEGKEDFVRGETACLRGIDVLGSINQIGAPLGRKLAAQSQAAGFVARHLPGGKAFLSVETRATRGLDHGGAISKSRLVARNARMVARSLKNFQGGPAAGKKRVAGILGAEWVNLVGDADWDDLLGGFGADMDDLIGHGGFDEIFGARHPDGVQILLGANQRETSALVGDAFDDVLGATAPRRGARLRALPTAAQIRTLARDLEKSADKLDASAGKHEKNVEKTKARSQAGALRIKLAKATRVLPAAGKTTTTRAALPAAGRAAATTAAAGRAAAPRMIGYGLVFDNIIGVTPDPKNPGYNTDGSIDWSWSSDGTPTGYNPDGTPAGGGQASDSDYTPPDLPPGPPDYGIEPAPEKVPPLEPGVDFIPDPAPDQAVNDTNEYNSKLAPLPLGIVYYENQKGKPFRFIGSRTYFTGDAPPDSGKTSGFVWWGGDHFGFVDWSQMGDRIRNVPPGSGLDTVEAVSRNSMARGWGPIVGDPGSDDWKHMRMDVGTGKPFFFRNTAPPWATVAEDMDRWNKLLLERQAQVTEAKTRYLQAVAQAEADKADADRRAKEWSNEQERMQQEQARFEQQQAQQQATLEMQMQQQQLQLEAQQAQQAQQIEAQTEQAELQYATQQQQLEYQQQQAETSAYQKWLESGGAGQAPGGGEGGGEGDGLGEPTDRDAQAELESNGSRLSDAGEETWEDQAS